MFPFEANTYNADSANVLRAIGNVHYTSKDWVLAKEFYTFAMDAVIFATTAAIGVVGADPSYRDYHDPEGQRDAAATAQYDGNTKLMALHGNRAAAFMMGECWGAAVVDCMQATVYEDTEHTRTCTTTTGTESNVAKCACVGRGKYWTRLVKCAAGYADTHTCEQACCHLLALDPTDAFALQTMKDQAAAIAREREAFDLFVQGDADECAEYIYDTYGNRNHDNQEQLLQLLQLCAEMEDCEPDAQESYTEDIAEFVSEYAGKDPRVHYVAATAMYSQNEIDTAVAYLQTADTHMRLRHQDSDPGLLGLHDDDDDQNDGHTASAWEMIQAGITSKLQSVQAVLKHKAAARAFYEQQEFELALGGYQMALDVADAIVEGRVWSHGCTTTKRCA